MKQKKYTANWLAATIAIMFVLPCCVAMLASECAGMALCIILFFIVNPAYSISIGIFSGLSLHNMWYFPILSPIIFLVGAWTFFDPNEIWFTLYAAAYFLLSGATMAISALIRKSRLSTTVR